MLEPMPVVDGLLMLRVARTSRTSCRCLYFVGACVSPKRNRPSKKYMRGTYKLAPDSKYPTAVLVSCPCSVPHPIQSGPRIPVPFNLSKAHLPSMLVRKVCIASAESISLFSHLVVSFAMGARYIAHVPFHRLGIALLQLGTNRERSLQSHESCSRSLQVCFTPLSKWAEESKWYCRCFDHVGGSSQGRRTF